MKRINIDEDNSNREEESNHEGGYLESDIRVFSASKKSNHFFAGVNFMGNMVLLLVFCFYHYYTNTMSFVKAKHYIKDVILSKEGILPIREIHLR